MVKSSTHPNFYPGLYVYFSANRMFIKTWHFLWLVMSSALTKENDDFGTQPTSKTKISNICKVISYPYIFTAVRYWKYIETFDILQHLSFTHTLSPHTHSLCIYIYIFLLNLVIWEWQRIKLILIQRCQCLCGK